MRATRAQLRAGDDHDPPRQDRHRPLSEHDEEPQSDLSGLFRFGSKKES